MKLRFVIPNMKETFGILEYAGEGDIIQERVNNRMTVVARTYNLFSSEQPADDIEVIIPASVNEKHFAFEQPVKLVNPRITAEGYRIGNRAFTKYLLFADDIVAL